MWLIILPARWPKVTLCPQRMPLGLFGVGAPLAAAKLFLEEASLPFSA